MHYLADASVVTEFLITDTYTYHATVFFRGALSGDMFSVPDLCLTECTNVIWKSVQFRHMGLLQAEQALSNLRSLPLRRLPTKAILKQALQIALKHRHSVYDTVYIALALKYRLPLVTLDNKQAQVATHEGVVIIPVTQFR